MSSSIKEIEKDLKQCALCGGEGDLDWEGGYNSDYYWVDCWDCLCSTKEFGSIKEVCDAWNSGKVELKNDN